MKHKIIYSLLGMALSGMVAWNIYIWGDNNYWKGIKDASTFARCMNYTPWTSDVVKMRGFEVNSCQELEIILDPEADKLASKEIEELKTEKEKGNR